MEFVFSPKLLKSNTKQTINLCNTSAHSSLGPECLTSAVLGGPEPECDAVSVLFVMCSILEFLRDYEHSQRGLFTKVLHGDAVFSNVLLKGDNTVVLLDMRGCLGKKLTLVGDAVYDLAKVYQSLCGYDYFLLDQPVLSDDEEILLELRGCFSQYLELHYPTVSMDDVKMIAASHYFSLIPLHTEASVDRKVLFWQQCKNCVRSSSYTQSALA